MWQYLLRRLLILIPVLAGISLVLFTILAMAPGDPFEELATNPNVPAEVRMNLRAKFGLDDPIAVRYVRWFTSMLRGDWGFSFASRVNVDTLILQRLPTSLFVLGSAQLLGILIALPIGTLSAVRPYSIFDQIATTLAFIGFSLPTFFTGILFILFFSIYLDWLPFIYRADISATGWRWWWEHARQAIMPVAVLGLAQGAALTRFVRSAVLDVDPPRLHQHRAGQGAGRARDDHQARRAQRAHPGGHPGGAADPHHLHGRGDHRADLPGAGHRLAADQRDPGQRHAGDHGHHLRVLLPGGDLQPDRRSALRLARSPDHLPLTMARALPVRDAWPPRSARAAARRPTSLWLEALHRFRKHRLAVMGAVILLTMVTAVAVGPFVYRVPIDEIDFKAKLRGPSRAHPLGTDDLGQDLLARMLYGGRISLAVGITAMLIALTIGVSVGAAAGHFGGVMDHTLMRITDLFISLPQLPLLLLIVYLFRESLKKILGPEAGIFILIVAIIAGLRWMPVARLVRAQFLSLREKEFVEAARGLGAPPFRQVVRHILPNALGPVIVAGTIDVAAAIIIESSLSFLGLGLPARHSHVGTDPLRRQGQPRLRPALGDLPGHGDLPHRAVHQLHR